jgi:hypothetical protein
LHIIRIRAPIAIRAEVEHRDGAFVGFEEEVYDMVPEEAAAANYEHFSERLLFEGRNGCHYHGLEC